jgi:hypothetical protein
VRTTGQRQGIGILRWNLSYDRTTVGFFFAARFHEPIESKAAAASAQTLKRRMATLRDAEE